jgi:hypothetical protein
MQHGIVPDFHVASDIKQVWIQAYPKNQIPPAEVTLRGLFKHFLTPCSLEPLLFPVLKRMNSAQSHVVPLNHLNLTLPFTLTYSKWFSTVRGFSPVPHMHLSSSDACQCRAVCVIRMTSEHKLLTPLPVAALLPRPDNLLAPSSW